MTGQVGSGLLAVAVVDSRNAVGQVEEVLGVRRYPDVAGLKAGLALYGFNVSKVVAVVATRSSGTHSERLKRALDLNVEYATRIRAAGGLVLDGYLRDSYGKMEEKQVDVLCARAIADEAYAANTGSSSAEAIVVVSKDNDLSPMFDFAAELGIRTFAAAPSAVDNRSPYDWLLLSEMAIRLMTTASGLIGHAARDEVAAYAFERWNRSYKWKIVGSIRRNSVEKIKVIHASGLYGVVDRAEFPSGLPARGGIVELYPIGVDLGERGREFPLLDLSLRPAQVVNANLMVASVTGRPNATQVWVKISESGASHKIAAPVDNLHIGRKVLVRQDQAEVRLVGGLEPCSPPPSGISSSMAPIVVEIGETSTNAYAEVTCPDGSRGLLRLPRGHEAKIGARYAALVLDPQGSPGPLLMAVSSRL